MRTYSRKRPEYLEIEGVKDLCRLCLEKPEASVPIFTNNLSDSPSALSTRIMMCVGFEVIRDDSLPNIVCSSCYTELNRYYTFRKKCEVSYQKLKYHLFALKEKETSIENGIKKQKINLHEIRDIELLNGHQNLVFTVNMDGTIQINESNNCFTADEFASLLKNTGQIVSEPAESTEHTYIQMQSRETDTKNNESSIENNVPNIEVTKTFELPSESNPVVLPDPDPSTELSTFITTALLRLGIVNQQEDQLVLQPGTNTLELEMGDGSQITFQIVEESRQQTEIPIQPALKEKPKTASVTNKKKGCESQSLLKGRAWCHLCRKAFVNRSALARHTREVHDKEKPHTCSVCGKSFAQKNVMLRHMLIHEAKRPFQCSVCPKSFTQRGALAAHRRTHAPPHARHLHIYQCPKCPKVFLYHSGLSRHMAGVHSGKQHPCPGCERRFTDQSSLARHVKTTKHHPPADT